MRMIRRVGHQRLSCLVAVQFGIFDIPAVLQDDYTSKTHVKDGRSYSGRSDTRSENVGR